MAEVSLYRAAVVLPMSAEPIRDGGLAVEEGKVLAVGPWAELSRQFGAGRRHDLGQRALLPCLINAHTHLDLSGLGAVVVRRGPFVSWLVLMALRSRSLSREQLLEGAWQGVEEVQASGTYAVVDISRSGAAVGALAESGLGGILCREVLSVEASAATRLLDEARADLEAWARLLPPSVRPGLSLHAPYSVSRALFEAAARLMRDERLPIVIHAAESEAEVEWLRTGGGPLAGLLSFMPGADGHKHPGTGAISYLDEVGVLGPNTFLVHCVHVGEDEMALIARSGARVVLCPRSNASLGVGVAPAQALRRAGVSLLLGTDSLASNTSLSLFDELRAAREIYSLEPWALLEMVTSAAGAALAPGSGLGTLAAGAPARAVAVALAERVDTQGLPGYIVERACQENAQVLTL